METSDSVEQTAVVQAATKTLSVRVPSEVYKDVERLALNERREKGEIQHDAIAFLLSLSREAQRVVALARRPGQHLLHQALRDAVSAAVLECGTLAAIRDYQELHEAQCYLREQLVKALPARNRSSAVALAAAGEMAPPSTSPTQARAGSAAGPRRSAPPKGAMKKAPTKKGAVKKGAVKKVAVKKATAKKATAKKGAVKKGAASAVRRGVKAAGTKRPVKTAPKQASARAGKARR